jgi:hypothetical protein
MTWQYFYSSRGATIIEFSFRHLLALFLININENNYKYQCAVGEHSMLLKDFGKIKS